MIATCSRGLEEVLAGELRELGAANVRGQHGAVAFAGTLRTLYEVNLNLRTAIRVLRPLTRGRVNSRTSLYELAARVSWEHFLADDGTFAVQVTGRHEAFANTVFAAQVVKDAVVDRMREVRRQRPTVDKGNPDLRLNLHLGDGETSLGIDSSGEPLSHRGYRPRGGPAPLSETLAAGMLLLAGYDGSQPLLDPMCGTGTIVIEAALLACRTAPGMNRSFAFERWPSFDQQLYSEVRGAAAARRRPPPQLIFAADVDRKAVKATLRNLQAAGVEEAVRVAQRDALELVPPDVAPGLIVSNPPYGKRVGEVEALRDLYKTLGDRFKGHAAGWTAWLLLGERELAKEIGLRASRRIPLFNGPIECRFMRFDMYEGSRKGTPRQ